MNEKEFSGNENCGFVIRSFTPEEYQLLLSVKEFLRVFIKRGMNLDEVEEISGLEFRQWAEEYGVPMAKRLMENKDVIGAGEGE